MIDPKEVGAGVVGFLEGIDDGSDLEGCVVGWDEGGIVYSDDGCVVGWDDSCSEGLLVGTKIGGLEGRDDDSDLEGCIVGWDKGSIVYLDDGGVVGWDDSSSEGCPDAWTEGWNDVLKDVVDKDMLGGSSFWNFFFCKDDDIVAIVSWLNSSIPNIIENMINK